MSKTKGLYRVTMYQYEDMEDDSELDPDYQLTDTLYDKELMSRDEVVMLIRDYWTYQSSCSPMCESGHCWLSSEPDHPTFGTGGQTYVDLFIKEPHTNKGVPGRHLAKLMKAAGM